MSGEVNINDEIDSFIKEVSALKLCWSVDRGNIRASNRWCPIVALGRAKWGWRNYNNSSWQRCAHDLGLSAKAALAIVWAADGICNADYRELRPRLIKALGITI